MTAMFLILASLACTGPSPMDETPRPEIPTTAEPAVTPEATPTLAVVASEGLTVPSTVSLGDAFTVAFNRDGPNGCYRQTEVNTQLNNGEKKVFHRYTTSSEGEMCTQMMVPGGFTTEVTLPERGEWSGTVQVDGKTAATYTIAVQ